MDNTKQSFPEMSYPDIIESLGCWGLAVSETQLTHPSSAFVEMVYSTCLKQVSGVESDSIYKAIAPELAARDDPDMFAGSISFVAMLYHLTQFSIAAKIDGFSAADIAFPEQHRTKVLLSAFINYIKFAEQNCDFIKDLRDGSSAIYKERASIAQQLEAVNGEALKIREKYNREKPESERIERENERLKTEILAKKALQTSLLQETENLKAEKKSLLASKEAIASEINAAATANASSKARIVQSPERIKRSIVTMGTSATEDKKIVIANEANARALQAKITKLLDIGQEVRSCVDQLRAIEKEVKQLSKSSRELTLVKSNLEAKDVERNELTTQRDRVRKQLSHAHEKLERAHRHAEDKKLASQKTIDRLQHEYDDMVLERRENDSQVEELRREVGQVEAQMHAHLKQSETELNDLLAAYLKIRHETDVYMALLADKLNMQIVDE